VEAGIRCTLAGWTKAPEYSTVPCTFGATWAPERAAEGLGNYPALGRKAAAAIPRARLVEIDDAGHLPQVEALASFLVEGQ
jgi:pimeloyl-ACP methyl ester carboxylesterase